MANMLVGRLERERARLVARLEKAKTSPAGMGGLAIGAGRQRQIAECQNAIDRIDHNLRVIANADRT